MSNRITITVSTALESVLDCGENTVSPEDYALADLSDDDLAGAICDTIRVRAERARYGHKPPREATPTTGKDYSTTDAPD